MRIVSNDSETSHTSPVNSTASPVIGIVGAASRSVRLDATNGGEERSNATAATTAKDHTVERILPAVRHPIIVGNG